MVHPQLDGIAGEFRSAQDRLHALERALPSDRWPVRADPARWSVSECVAHLNLTGRAYLPLLENAVARAREMGQTDPKQRYRRDFAGWALWRSLGPPVRFKFKTTAPFMPEAIGDAPELIAEFDQLQARQLGYLGAADGLPLSKISVTSPFEARMKYNLFACFSILPRHQHRHLWQAEQLWKIP